MKAQLAKALAWGDAHAGFDRAVQDFPPALRGRRVRGLPHSAWEILEHLRIAQHDILDFARNPKYETLDWPADYWPPSPAPPDTRAWERSVTAFKRDRTAIQRLVTNPRIRLDRRIPHGQGQTYQREVLLVLDHNAYHVGELVQLRRLLGAWPPA
jgi:uncharacterized damage-inducible protein DinB